MWNALDPHLQMGDSTSADVSDPGELKISPSTTMDVLDAGMESTESFTLVSDDSTADEEFTEIPTLVTTYGSGLAKPAATTWDASSSFFCNAYIHEISNDDGASDIESTVGDVASFCAPDTYPLGDGRSSAGAGRPPDGTLPRIACMSANPTNLNGCLIHKGEKDDSRRMHARTINAIGIIINCRRNSLPDLEDGESMQLQSLPCNYDDGAERSCSMGSKGVVHLFASSNLLCTELLDGESLSPIMESRHEVSPTDSKDGVPA